MGAVDNHMTIRAGSIPPCRPELWFRPVFCLRGDSSRGKVAPFMMARSLFCSLSLSVAVHAAVLGTAVWLWKSGDGGSVAGGEQILSIVRVEEETPVAMSLPRSKPLLATPPMPMPEVQVGRTAVKVDLLTEGKPQRMAGQVPARIESSFKPATDKTAVVPKTPPPVLPAARVGGGHQFPHPPLPPVYLPTVPPTGSKVVYARLLRTNNPLPDYLSRMALPGQRGVAVLLVTVDKSGAVVEVEVEHSSGHRAFDAAAARAVRGWPFAAARVGGRAVWSRVRVPVRLDGGR